MTITELKTKVINAQAKVEKKAAIVKKHRERLNKLIASGADEYDIKSKRGEIKEAEKKLIEARATLQNWETKLGEKIQEDEYLAANTPEILAKFLENWKQKAIAYYKERFAKYIQLRDELRQQELDARREALQTLPELERARTLYRDKELTSYDLANLFPRKPVEDFLHERGLDYKQIKEKTNRESDGIICKMLRYRDQTERDEWLEHEMEQERRAKLLDLISRITKVVGRITDTALLSISNKGDINGIISGSEGRARLETIGAGGYNIQCFHFRTLVHEL